MARRYLKNNSSASPWLLGIAALAFGASQARAQEYDSDWTRNFRLGALVGFNIKANFKTSGNFGVSGVNPGPMGVSGANHIFDDGYVRVDQTHDAGGWTSYWGYDNASQFDGNHTLTMHATTGFSTTASGSAQDEPYVGFDLAYGGNIWRSGSLRIGWELGFGMLPIKITERASSAASITQSTYSFDTGGIVMPSAPYQGGNSGIGPTIHDTATLVSSQNVSGTVSGTHTLDVTLYNIKLGPTLYWDVTQRIGLQFGGGAALGIVSGNLQYDEMISISGSGPVHNVGSVGSTDTTYGGYVNAMITFHTVKNGDFFLSGEFMPMGTAKIGGGGREGDLNLRGQVYVSAGVNWPF